MQNLIAKLQDTIGEAQKIINDNKALSARVLEKEIFLEDKENNLRAFAQDLSIRESKVSVIESISQAKKENDLREQRLSEDRSNLEAEKQVFKTWKDEQKQLLDNQKKELSAMEQELNDRSKNMESEIYKKMEEVLKTRK